MDADLQGRSRFADRFRRKPVRTSAALLIAIAATAYVFEAAAIALHVPPFRNPVGQILVDRTYVLHKARTKVDIYPAEWEPQDCVRAVFPHRGLTPCWWLARHTEQQIDWK